TSQMMWSFKAGHLLGASPRRQIVAQCAGAIVGVAVAVPVFALIVRAYGLGTPVMPAAAPLSWKVTAEAVAGGASAMPRHAISAALMACVVGIGVTLLNRTRIRRFLPSPIALGTAFLTPASYALAMCGGAIIAAIMQVR